MREPAKSAADARSILGVATSATATEVQRAFRIKAKQVHPDAIGSERSAMTILDLVEARKILLALPPSEVVERRRRTVVPPTSPSPPIREPRAAEVTAKRDRVLLMAGAVLIGAVTILLAGTLIWGAVANRGLVTPAAEPSLDCLAVSDDNVASAVSCDAPGALRITSVADGIRACIPSMTRIDVGGKTYCLTESNPG